MIGTLIASLVSMLLVCGAGCLIVPTLRTKLLDKAPYLVILTKRKWAPFVVILLGMSGATNNLNSFIAQIHGFPNKESYQDAVKQNISSYDDYKIFAEKRMVEEAALEEVRAKERKIVDAKRAEERKVADAKAAEEKRIADEKAAEEKKLAEAKALSALGFSSTEQKLDLQKRGYQNYAAYNTVKSLTPEKFLTDCKAPSRAVFEAQCKGKKISWRGEISSFSSDGVNVKVLTDDGSDAKFSIDSKSLRSFVTSGDKGKILEFEGIVERQNIVSPDIEQISFSRIETDEQLNSRKEAQLRIAKEKERNDAMEVQRHLEDAEWLDKKFDVVASIACRPEIEKLAKFNFEWIDGFLETKFDSYSTKTVTPGVLRISGEKIKFQNGFGAWQIMRYRCDYDVVNKRVVNTGANPR